MNLEKKKPNSEDYHSEYTHDFNSKILEELAEVYAPSLERLHALKNQHPTSFYSTADNPFGIQVDVKTEGQN